MKVVHAVRELIFNPLAHYGHYDYFTQQKVKVVHILCFFAIFIGAALSIQMSFLLHQVAPVLQASLFATGVLEVVLLVVLRKGHLELALSGFLYLSTILLWAFLFIEAVTNKENPIFVLDTIVYLYSQLVLAALLSSSRKVFVPIFYLFNIGALIAYTMYVKDKFNLVDNFALEYFMDNFFSIIIIFIVSTCIRSLNDKALTKIKIEMQKNIALNETLEKRVTLRTQELASQTEKLQRTQQELIENALNAGRAEIAINILHNVGNILNSVMTANEEVIATVKSTVVKKITRANNLFKEQMEAMEDFIQKGQKRKKLLEYYCELEKLLIMENETTLKNSIRLKNMIDTINEIIVAQQAYISDATPIERVSLEDAVNNALNLQTGLFIGVPITIIKKFNPVPPVDIQKVKFIFIIKTILTNAKEALDNNDPENRIIILSIDRIDKSVFLRIRDNGIGIPPEERETLFFPRYGTKEHRRGFNLHSSANYMKEMGGSLTTESEGIGKGTVFILQFPAA